MKRILQVEERTHKRLNHPKSWVARVSLAGKGGIERSFVSFAKRDYSGANGCGSCGIMRLYVLDENTVYEVQEPQGWKHAHRRFMLHDGSSWLELSLAEAIQCLTSKSTKS